MENNYNIIIYNILYIYIIFRHKRMQKGLNIVIKVIHALHVIQKDIWSLAGHLGEGKLRLQTPDVTRKHPLVGRIRQEVTSRSS